LGPAQQNLQMWEEVWTGDYIFENDWQSFRTKKDRTLELKSVFHECEPLTAKDRGQGGGYFRQRHDDDRRRERGEEREEEVRGRSFC